MALETVCKLLDLSPRWLTIESGRKGMGISFRCPHCQERNAIMFENPLDEGPPAGNGTLWKRYGDTFENLSLEPSINVKGHWHGFIKNGDVLI
jgi:hypothetical protein